jgi:hypothetical protein
MARNIDTTDRAARLSVTPPPTDWTLISPKTEEIVSEPSTIDLQALVDRIPVFSQYR